MKEEYQLLIEKKLREELSAEEESLFLEKLEADSDFQEYYLFEKQLIENLNEDDWDFSKSPDREKLREYADLFRSEKTMELKETLKKIKVNYGDNQDTSGIKNSWMLYGLAAAIVILVISVFSLMNSTQTTDELYLSYFDKEEVPSLIHRGNNVDNQIGEAQKFFENGDYKSALLTFDELLKSKKTNRATIYIYKGVSEMELNKFANAEETFETLIRSDLMDAPKGYWYLSLLYLKMGKSDKAKKVLENIKSESLYNHEKAAEILKSL